MSNPRDHDSDSSSYCDRGRDADDRNPVVSAMESLEDSISSGVSNNLDRLFSIFGNGSDD